MIKFNCLIHKETGTVISYIDWKVYASEGLSITINNDVEHGQYDALKILINDDFEIIYDSEFTGEELWLIHCRCGEDENLQDKVQDILKNRDGLQSKYGIEV